MTTSDTTAKHPKTGGRFRLPDPPQREPDEMTQYDHLFKTGNSRYLALHQGNPESTLVEADRWIVADPSFNKSRARSPDLLVAFGVDPDAYGLSNGYVVSEQGKPPDFVLEVASESTAEIDVGEKRWDYAGLGIPEYWRFDETGEHYGEKLAGERLVDGEYVELPIGKLPDGSLQGYSLALDLNIRWQSGELVFWDPATERPIATLEDESEVTITLDSKAGDSYLYLREGYVEFGEAVNDHVADDDSLGWPDAQVRERLVPGTYTIEATTYKPYQSGSFALSLSRLGEETPAPPTPTPTAPPVATCEDTVGGDVQVNGEWISECESEERQGSYARYYTFEIAEESEVAITLEARADAYLYLREGYARVGTAVNDSENDDDAGGGTNAQIVQTLEPGVYTIEATTYEVGGSDSFTLRLEIR